MLIFSCNMDLSAITYSVFLPLLDTIHKFLSSTGLLSYGWAIVFLTAGVKLILTPLTFKQIKSARKMQAVQPRLKTLQEDFKKREARLKDDAQKLNQARMDFQQKMMGFYKENDINPLGGCLPLLVQMPILLGLFWTFSGSPFQEKPIFVDVKIVSAVEANKKHLQPYGKGEIFVDTAGKRARIALNAKKLTLVEGESFTLNSAKTEGDAAFDPALVTWKFFDGKQSNEFISLDSSLADGSAEIKALKAGGKVKIQASLPKTIEHDKFFFIDDLGDTGIMNKESKKVNYDIIILVLLFGISIWLSTKLNAPKLAPLKPGEVEDAQAAMQRSMSTMMPIMMTGMMLFVPLPAGAFLYMIVSSFIQAAQTFFAQKRYDKKFVDLF
jgi:YidC/Oxa1 family membrane protein insertase